MITMQWIEERCRPDGDCLLWRHACSAEGHPRFNFKRPDGTCTSRQARRVVWELEYGPIPPGRYVSVTCGCAACLEVRHMELSTRSDVVRRVWAQADARVRKVIAVTAASRARAKLDMGKARQIRASGKKIQELADEYGVSIGLISQVRLGKRWREVASNPFAGLGRRV